MSNNTNNNMESIKIKLKNKKERNFALSLFNKWVKSLNW